MQIISSRLIRKRLIFSTTATQSVISTIPFGQLQVTKEHELNHELVKIIRGGGWIKKKKRSVEKMQMEFLPFVLLKKQSNSL